MAGSNTYNFRRGRPAPGKGADPWRRIRPWLTRGGEAVYDEITGVLISKHLAKPWRGGWTMLDLIDTGTDEEA